jgi:hypothetical protein
VTPRTPADLFREAREAPARHAATQYAEAFERHAEAEQMHRLMGNYPEAEQEHNAAVICLLEGDAEVRRG